MTVRLGFTDFLRRVANRDRAGLYAHYKAALSEDSGVGGGYLVPSSLRDDLFATVEESAIVRPRAKVVPMSTLTCDLPIPDVTTARAAGIPPYFGGIDLRWTQEASTRTESEPAWRQVELRAWGLGGTIYASNDLLADATGTFDAYLRTLFGRAVAWYEDYAFLRGNGLAKPLGMSGCPGRLTVTRNASSHFKYVDGTAMIAKLLPSSFPRAVFVMHPTVVLDMLQYESTTTTIFQGNVPRIGSDGSVGSLYCVPVYASGSLPAIGTEGDVILIDPSLYVIGDRSSEIAVSAHEPTAFLKGQTVFRIHHRVAGQPWLSAPVTLADGTQTVSPYITLV